MLRTLNIDSNIDNSIDNNINRLNATLYTNGTLSRKLNTRIRNLSCKLFHIVSYDRKKWYFIVVGRIFFLSTSKRCYKNLGYVGSAVNVWINLERYCCLLYIARRKTTSRFVNYSGLVCTGNSLKQAIQLKINHLFFTEKIFSNTFDLAFVRFVFLSRMIFHSFLIFSYTSPLISMEMENEKRQKIHRRLLWITNVELI